MKSIKQTSMLICMTIFVAFLAAGGAVKWPEIAQMFPSRTVAAPSPANGVDPFRYDPPLPSLVKDLRVAYTLRAELHPDRAEVKGSVTIQFDNPLTEDVRLYAYDYPFSPMSIRSVRWEGGEIPFVKSGRLITFPNVFGQETRPELTVDFVASVPQSGTRFGVQDGVWTLTNWYPMLGALDQQGNWYPLPRVIGYGDPFVYHYGDYQVTFISPADFQWVTSWGRGEARQRSDGRQELRFHAKRILSFALVGSPRFHVERVQVTPSLAVDIAAVSPEHVQRIRETALPVLQTYTELFGDLPYPIVAIAETSRTDPLEYANIAIFGRDLYERQEVEHWLPHEIAHMWWYNTVNTVEPLHGWIDEGLVEASVAYFRERQGGPQAYRQVMAGYEADVEQLKRKFPAGNLSQPLERFAHYYEFHWTWYSKAALLYEHLRRSIGDDAYFRFLQQVQRTYRGHAIGPEHLDQALGRVLNGQARYFVPHAARPHRSGFASPVVDPYVETIVNGTPYYPAVPAREIEGTAYLPLRDIAERLGWQVTWRKDGTIQLKKGARTVSLHESGALVNVAGETVQLDHPVREIANRTMVPLSFWGQTLGCELRYDPDRKSVQITAKEHDTAWHPTSS